MEVFTPTSVENVQQFRNGILELQVDEMSFSMIEVPVLLIIQFVQQFSLNILRTTLDVLNYILTPLFSSTDPSGPKPSPDMYGIPCKYRYFNEIRQARTKIIVLSEIRHVVDRCSRFLRYLIA